MTRKWLAELVSSGPELPRTHHRGGSRRAEAVGDGENLKQIRCDRDRVNWGDGTLNFEGKTHPFSIDGLTVVDLGISSVIHGRRSIQPDKAV